MLRMHNLGVKMAPKFLGGIGSHLYYEATLNNGGEVHSFKDRQKLGLENYVNLSRSGRIKLRAIKLGGFFTFIVTWM